MTRESDAIVFTLALVNRSEHDQLTHAQKDILRREYCTNSDASQALLELEKLWGLKLLLRAT